MRKTSKPVFKILFVKNIFQLTLAYQLFKVGLALARPAELTPNRLLIKVLASLLLGEVKFLNALYEIITNLLWIGKI